MSKGEHLGDLEELVLLAVLRLGPHAHGGKIREELDREAKRSVSVSTVYVTLMRLEEKGYVSSWKGHPTASRGGKAKRFFEVCSSGLQALQSVRAVRDRMWAGIKVDAH